LKNKKTIHN